MCVVIVIREKIIYPYGPFQSPELAWKFIEDNVTNFVGCDVSTYKLCTTPQ